MCYKKDMDRTLSPTLINPKYVQLAQEVAQHNTLGTTDLYEIISSVHSANSLDSSLIENYFSLTNVTSLLVKTANESVQKTRLVAEQIKQVLKPTVETST